MNPIDEALEAHIRERIDQAMAERCANHGPYVACSNRISDAALEVANDFILTGWKHPNFSVAGLNLVCREKPPHHEDDPRWEPLFICNM